MNPPLTSRRRWILGAPKVVFVVLLIAIVIAHKLSDQRVLVLHSYQTDYDWVVKINEGIERVKPRYPNVTWRFHYMDLKNHPERSDEAVRAAVDVIRAWGPKVVLLVDNNAQLAALQVIDEGIEVVFAGINGDPAPGFYRDGKLRPNVHGILERKPLDAIKDVAVLVAGLTEGACKGCKKAVRFIGDGSSAIADEVGFYAKGYDGKLDWGPLEWRGHVLARTFTEWRRALQAAASGAPGERADVVLITNYRQVRAEGWRCASCGPRSPSRRDDFVDAVALMRWTQACAPVPVVAMGWTNAQDGARLAIATSPFEQGEVAALGAVALAYGRRWPFEQEVIDSTQFVVSIREPARGEARHTDAVYETFFERYPLYRAFARATGGFIAADEPAKWELPDCGEK